MGWCVQINILSAITDVHLLAYTQVKHTQDDADAMEAKT